MSEINLSAISSSERFQYQLSRTPALMRFTRNRPPGPPPRASVQVSYQVDETDTLDLSGRFSRDRCISNDKVGDNDHISAKGNVMSSDGTVRLAADRKHSLRRTQSIVNPTDDLEIPESPPQPPIDDKSAYAPRFASPEHGEPIQSTEDYVYPALEQPTVARRTNKLKRVRKKTPLQDGHNGMIGLQVATQVSTQRPRENISKLKKRRQRHLALAELELVENRADVAGPPEPDCESNPDTTWIDIASYA